MRHAIAIDGPAGAGKSTIAKQVAKELGYIYVDTGAMYRAMGLYFHQKGIAPDDMASMTARCGEADIEIRYADGRQQVWLNGENVTDSLRTEEAGFMASACGRNPQVRIRLVELQRQLADKADVVMDGRDIGTHVLPHAPVKIYLTASVDTRAQRRCRELEEKGEPAELEQIKADIAARDQQDMTREVSPLRQAEDAVLLDCSHMTIEEVTEKVMELAAGR